MSLKDFESTYIFFTQWWIQICVQLKGGLTVRISSRSNALEYICNGIVWLFSMIYVVAE